MNRFATTGRWLGAAALMVALAVPALAQRNVTLRLNTATLPDTTLPSLFNPDASGAGMQLRGGLESGTTALPDGNTITWDSGTTLVPTNVGTSNRLIGAFRAIPTFVGMNRTFRNQQSCKARS